MSGDFRDRVALVTGAAAGIGCGVATAFARAGAKVALVDINEAGGRALEGALQSEGGLARFFPADVTDEAAVARAFRAAEDEFGRLDVLVNNAGASPRKRFEDLSYGEWRAILDLNLSSVFLCARAALPLLRRNEGASILNLGSLHATKTVPGLSAYAAAKGGVEALTRSLALELAPDIRVNAIAPGLIETAGWRGAVGDVEVARQERLPYHPLGRLGIPDDVSTCALFLCSGAASYLTGITLPVAGGLGLQLYP